MNDMYKLISHLTENTAFIKNINAVAICRESLSKPYA